MREGMHRDTGDDFRIGALARKCGVTSKTIRYYEDLGLLPRPDRTPSGYRRYGPSDVARLNFIRKAKALSLSLKDIAEILALHADGARPCGHVRAHLDAKIELINNQIIGLGALRENLQRLRREAQAVDRHENHGAVCPIIEQGA